MQSHIRNFCIIAHIDHGKSTLADRLLQITGTVAARDMQEQILDSNPIERERGITIKLAPVRMEYQLENDNYILNLIDTPGHVDFTYEVSRSLQACEGAILVVDATQGVQAQTLANLNLARAQKLKIIPALNKIDMPNAQIEEVEAQIISLGFQKEEIMHISAKTGKGVPELLKQVIQYVPEPQGDPHAPLRALIFSSGYDIHRGVVVFVRVVDGSFELKPDIQIRFFASNAVSMPIDLGYFAPKMYSAPILHTGEVGFIATGLKEVAQAKVGDTITIATSDTHISPLPGYKEPKSMVFLGLFPINGDEYPQVREAMGKLRLSDSAFTYRPISSLALGHGFHCGFLGLLHAEIVQERLSREFNLSLFATAPQVEYLIKFKMQNAKFKIEKDGFARIQSASEYPDPSFIDQVREPMMSLTIFSPKKYVGDIMQLCQDKRAEFMDLEYIGASADTSLEGPTLIKATYIIPLSEMIIDFFDLLKSATSGYASLDYDFFDTSSVSVVKLDVLVNKEKVDAFSQLVVESRAQAFATRIVEKLAEVIPRRQFQIPIQAAVGGKVIARADVKAFRKDVIQKLYGGDRSRKDKLLDKQKKGKAKMKQVGNVEIPQEAFLKVFSRS